MSKQPLPPDWRYNGPLAEKLGRWADSQLRTYLQLYPKNPNTGQKQIHDPVVGVVRLEAWEIFVLDSPLVQRLRYVRQLGVGHYLFPSAGYSRFEHSLGATHAAGAMFDSITSEGSRPQRTLSLDERVWYRTVVRLAALMHDVGHCVFSHVSEKFYKSHRDVEHAVRSLSQFYNTTVTASEAISIVLIQSEACGELLRRAQIQLPAAVEVDRIVDAICCCIAGAKSHLFPDCFVSEIVNGSVDCDKLDYLARDAHMAGVPVSLDIDRLLSKLRLVTVKDDTEDDDEYEEEQLLEVLQKRGRADLDTRIRHSLAIVPSAARAVEELLISRIFLYDKFYFHPKVMAAEEVLRRSLELLHLAYPKLTSVPQLLSFGDDEFLGLNRSKLRALFGKPRNKQAADQACMLLQRLRYRDLPKRCFAFAERYLPRLPEILARLEARGQKRVVKVGVAQYKLLNGALTDRSESLFEQDVLANCRALQIRTPVFLAHQSARRATGNLNIPVVLEDGTVERKAPFLFEAGTWTEAYAANKATSFVYTYHDKVDVLEKVHLAVERTLQDRDLAFSPNCAMAAKLGLARIDELRNHLPRRWHEQRVPPDILTRYNTRRRIEALNRKFAPTFSWVDNRFGGLLLSAWLSQFRDGDLRESAVRFLEYLRFVDQSTLQAEFSNLERRLSAQSAMWVPLAASNAVGKSADVIGRYLSASSKRQFRRHPSQLTAADLRRTRHVVFFDDSLNSGVQVSSLLSSWFGDPAGVAHAGDADPNPLAQQCVSLLRNCQISFAYYSVHPMGKQKLESTCARLGIQSFGIYGAIDTSKDEFRTSGFVAEHGDIGKRFRNALRDIGVELLREKDGNDVRAKQFALGYSGIDLALVFPNAISTSTPPALWYLSVDSVEPWVPVFPREKYRTQLQGVIENGLQL